MNNKGFSNNKEFSISIGRMILMLFMLMIVVVGGTFAWFTFSTKESALVLTIGNINNTHITLTPYQVKEEALAPVNTYTSGVSSDVIIRNNEKNNSVALYYKINQLDENLINNGLKYTIVDTNTNETVKTGDFKAFVGKDEALIYENNDIATNSTLNYRVYLWVDSSVGNQNNIAGSKIDMELNGAIGSIEIIGNNIYHGILSINVTDFDSHKTYMGDNSTVDYTYQWYLSSDDSMSGNESEKICGATSKSYVIGSDLGSGTDCINGYTAIFTDKYIYALVTVHKDGYTKTYKDIADSDADDGDYDNGSDKVTPLDLTVTAGNASKVYDGTRLTNSSCTSSGISDAMELTCKMTDDSYRIVYGVQTNKIDTVTIMISDEQDTGYDITNNYSITKVDGTLTINKADCVCTVNNIEYTTLIGPSETTSGTLNFSCNDTNSSSRYPDGERYVTSSDSSIVAVSNELFHFPLSANGNLLLVANTNATYSIAGNKVGDATLTVGAVAGTNYNACTVDETNVTVRTNNYIVNYYTALGSNRNYIKLGTSAHKYGDTTNDNKLTLMADLIDAQSSSINQQYEALQSNYGWTFIGWASSEDATNVYLTDGALASTLTETDGVEINLYAVYKRNIIFYSGEKSSITDGEAEQLWNRNTIESVDVGVPAQLYNWTPLGYRHDSVAGTQHYNYDRGSAILTPAYNASNNLYAVYNREVEFKSGVNGEVLDGTRTQYYNSYGTVGEISSFTPSELEGWVSVGYTWKKADTSSGISVDAEIDDYFNLPINITTGLRALYQRNIWLHSGSEDYGDGSVKNEIIYQYVNGYGDVTPINWVSPISVGDLSKVGWRTDESATNTGTVYKKSGNFFSPTPGINDDVTDLYALYSRNIQMFYGNENLGTFWDTTIVQYLNFSNNYSQVLLSKPSVDTVYDLSFVGWRDDCEIDAVEYPEDYDVPFNDDNYEYYCAIYEKNDTAVAYSGIDLNYESTYDVVYRYASGTGEFEPEDEIFVVFTAPANSNAESIDGFTKKYWQFCDVAVANGNCLSKTMAFGESFNNVFNLIGDDYYNNSYSLVAVYERELKFVSGFVNDKTEKFTQTYNSLGKLSSVSLTPMLDIATDKGSSSELFINSSFVGWRDDRENAYKEDFCPGDYSGGNAVTCTPSVNDPVTYNAVYQFENEICFHSNYNTANPRVCRNYWFYYNSDNPVYTIVSTNMRMPSIVEIYGWNIDGWGLRIFDDMYEEANIESVYTAGEIYDFQISLAELPADMVSMYSRDINVNYGLDELEYEVFEQKYYAYNNNKIGDENNLDELGDYISEVILPNIEDEDGWTFLGFRDDTTAGAKEYDSGYSVQFDDNSNYHAVYSNGGISFISGIDGDTQELSGMKYHSSSGSYSTSGKFPTPTAIEGFTALGWRDDTTASAKEYAIGADIPSASVDTYYAVYQRTIQVYSGGPEYETEVCDDDGCRFEPGDTSTVSSLVQYYNSADNVSEVILSTPTANTLRGLDFVGFRDDTTTDIIEYPSDYKVKVTDTANTYYSIYEKVEETDIFSGTGTNPTGTYDVLYRISSGNDDGDDNYSKYFDLVIPSLDDIEDISGWTKTGWCMDINDGGYCHPVEAGFHWYGELENINGLGGTGTVLKAQYSRELTFYSGYNKAEEDVFTQTYYSLGELSSISLNPVWQTGRPYIGPNNYSIGGWRDDTQNEAAESFCSGDYSNGRSVMCTPGINDPATYYAVYLVINDLKFYGALSYEISYYYNTNSTDTDTHFMNVKMSSLDAISGWTVEGWVEVLENGVYGNTKYLPGETYEFETNFDRMPTFMAIYSRDIMYFSGSTGSSSGGDIQYYMPYNSFLSEVKLPEPEPIDEMTALGWRDDTTAGDKEYDIGYSIKFGDPFVYYAVYSKSGIDFVSGSTNNVETSSSQYYNSSGNTSSSSDLGVFPEPVAVEGFTALGWRDDTTSSAKEYAIGANIPGESVDTYYAVYQRTIQVYSGGHEYETEVCDDEGCRLEPGDTSTVSSLVQYFNSNGDVSEVILSTPTANTLRGLDFVGFRDDTTTDVIEYPSDYKVKVTDTVNTYYAIYETVEETDIFSGTGTNPTGTYDVLYRISSGNDDEDDNYSKYFDLVIPSLDDIEDISGWTKTGWCMDINDGGYCHPVEAGFHWYGDLESINGYGGIGTDLRAQYSRELTIYSGTENSEVKTPTQYYTTGFEVSEVEIDNSDFTGADVEVPFVGFRTDTDNSEPTIECTTSTCAFAVDSTNTLYSIYSVPVWYSIYDTNTPVYGDSADAWYNSNSKTSDSIFNMNVELPIITAKTGWTVAGYRDDSLADAPEYIEGQEYSISFTFDNPFIDFLPVYSREITFYYWSDSNGRLLPNGVPKTQYYNNTDGTGVYSSIKSANPGTLSGWTAEGFRDDIIAGDKEYIGGASRDITPTGTSTTLYPVFSRDITFSSGKNTSQVETVKQYRNPGNDANSGLQIVSLPTPAAIDGFSILGWRDDKTNNGIAEFTGNSVSICLECSTRLYAIYERNVTFVSGAAAIQTELKQFYHSVMGTSFVTVSPNSMSSLGYSYVGYSETGTNIDVSSGTSWNPSVNTVNPIAYAKYTRTIKFNEENAYNTVTQCFISGGTCYNVPFPSVSTSPSLWTALGWRDDDAAAAAEYSVGSVIAPLSPTIIYKAVYSRNVVVTYNANAGSDSVENMPSSSSKTVVYYNAGGSISTNSPTVTFSSTRPRRSGYTFDGWSSTSTGIDRITSWTPYVSLGTGVWSSTVYAQWVEADVPVAT